jgi:hypothetical protein
MFHAPGKFTLILAAVLGLVFATPALAGPTVPHKESCDGNLTRVVNPPGPPPAVGIMDFAGSGVATHMGRYSIMGSHNFTTTGQVLGGRFVSTAADGSTIAGSYAGNFTPIAPNVVRFNVHVLYTTGTGRLAGVTGSADVVAVVNLATAKFHYDTLGTWTFP